MKDTRLGQVGTGWDRVGNMPSGGWEALLTTSSFCPNLLCSVGTGWDRVENNKHPWRRQSRRHFTGASKGARRGWDSYPTRHVSKINEPFNMGRFRS